MPVPVLLFVTALTLQSARPSADTTSIYIAATTDVHGRASAWDYERDESAPLGLARAATVIDSLRRAHPGRVVVVDAGDLLQGNSLALVASRRARRGTNPMVLALNRMRYDVATPGNHEFNYPLPLLDSLYRGRRFTLVSSNIVRARGGTPAYRTDTTLVRGGVRIAITGATTPGVKVWDGPHIAGRLDFRPVAEAVPPVVARMRSRGADVTVLVAHAGLDGESSYSPDAAPPENDVAGAIRASGDIDVAVIGHTHREIADSTVGTTLVVQPRNWAQSVAVARVDLVKEGGKWRVAGKHGTIVRLGNEAPDSALVAALAGWHATAREELALPIARSADAMPAARARLEDTPVMDFVAEAMRARAGTQLAATAAFSITGGIPRGDVRLRDLVSVYPYDNTLRAVKISGTDLRAYLEQSARYFLGMGPGGPVVNDSVPGYNFDMVSGVDYELDLSQPVGARVAQLMIDGHDVQGRDSFTLALNNYRQQGGGGFTMISHAPVIYDRNEDIRGILVDELQRRGTIRAADFFTPNWRVRGAGTQAVGARSDSILLRVFATNDIHGALEARVAPWSNRRPVGGMAALAGMMNRLATECGCPTVRLDGGDVMQGSAASNLTHGRAMVDAFGAAHIDAAAIGNHEFDWSVDSLAARIREARFAWLATNIIDVRTRSRPAWATPMAMVQSGSLRIAVVGYTTPGTTTSSNPVYVAQLGFGNAAMLDSAISQARAQRPDFVIVVAHEGAFCNSDNVCQGAVVDLAQALRNKPDLIVSGHTHSLVTTTVNGIPIIQARSSGTALGVVDFVRADSGRAVRMRVETVWADREQPDSAVGAVVRRYVEAARPLTDRVIARLDQDLPRSDSGFALADMVSDALRESAHADLGLVNLTGIRAPLWAGPVTWGQLYEVLPFGNYVVTLALSGRVLRDALNHGLGSGDARASVSGATVRLDRNLPRGSQVSVVTLTGGRVLQDDSTYTLATFDFLASGGSGYSMLRGKPTTNTGVDELDAFIAWLQRQPQPVRVAQPWTPRISDH